MKLCKNCRFCDDMKSVDPLCHHNKSKLAFSDDYVHGKIDHLLCREMRGSWILFLLGQAPCGPRARLFEEIPLLEVNIEVQSTTEGSIST